MLRQINNNLWVVEQPLKFLGIEVGTPMTVIKLPDNSLILISPIAINSELNQQLDGLGKVKYLIAPNLFHYLYLTPAQQLFPEAKLVAPPGLSDKQPELRIDLVFNQDLIEFERELEYTFLKGFQAFIPPKIEVVNEIIFYHPSSKTLIITDSAFNFDNTFPLITQLAVRLLGSYGVLKPSWLEKIAIKDQLTLKQSIDRILQWNFDRIIMAHGQIVEINAKQQLTKAYQWLLE